MTASFSKAEAVRNALKRRWDLYTDRNRKARMQDLRELGTELSSQGVDDEPYAGPEELRILAKSYRPATDMPLVDGKVPLVWWSHVQNYGDLLSPWLVGRMAERPVVYAPQGYPSVVAVGSIVNEARRDSIVWGSGAFGSEGKWGIKEAARYAAVRGPLTRSRLRNIGLDVPRVYGDPALLTPLYFYPRVEKDAEVGIVVRWSETAWRGVEPGPGVKLIDLSTKDVAGVTRQMMACKRIISSSLHGLVIADAYGIPNAWLESDSGAGGSRPAGGEFKFYDYMLSVNKVRHAQSLDFAGPVTVDRLVSELDFADEPIDFDHRALLDACPMLERTA